MSLKRPSNTNRLGGSTISGGSVPGWTADQNNVARQVMMYLMAGGLSKAGAAGMIGNWYQESSLTPSEPGGYLAQWGGSRLAALQSFASSIGKPVTSVEAQARFAVHELRASYPSLYSFLQSATDPSAAALAISTQYERPDPRLANNSNRVAQAVAAYGGITPAAGMAADGSNQGGSNPSSAVSAPTSILDLITSPVDVIGGWLASIAVNLIKDVAIGIGDYVIIPAWHWNQRAVDEYSTAMFTPSGWIMLLWTGTFWGLGYFLLFTSPDSKSLKPAPVAQSRFTHHSRGLQSVPARRSLIKPQRVKERTAKKPTPHTSQAAIRRVGTMSTSRPQTVTITGGRNDGRPRDSRPEGIPPQATRESSPRPRAAGSPHSANRARGNSLSGRSRTPQRSAGQSASDRRKS